MAEDVVLEERRMPEQTGMLGRKVTFRTETGVRRDIGIPFCHHCGRKLDDNQKSAVCSSCAVLVCIDCWIPFLGRVFCLNCVKTEVGISTSAMKVLVGINSELNMFELRSQLKMDPNELKMSIYELLFKELIKGKFLTFISGYKLTSRGRDSVILCSEILRREGRQF